MLVIDKDGRTVFHLEYLYCLYLIRNEIHIQDPSPKRFDTVCVKQFDDKDHAKQAFHAIFTAFENGYPCCEI